MADETNKLTVSFELERRGEELYFRAAHKSDAVWHGPYDDLEELSLTIAHYIGEDALEEWYKVSSAMFADLCQRTESVGKEK
jgi:hypothetical protein